MWDTFYQVLWFHLHFIECIDLLTVSFVYMVHSTYHFNSMSCPFVLVCDPLIVSRVVWVAMGLKLSIGISCALHLVLNWRRRLLKPWFWECKVCELLPIHNCVRRDPLFCRSSARHSVVLRLLCLQNRFIPWRYSISHLETTALELGVIFLMAPQ